MFIFCWEQLKKNGHLEDLGVNGKSKILLIFLYPCANLQSLIFLFIFIYLLQLGCYPVAVVILHVNKT